MAVINYSAEEINALLSKAATAAQPSAVQQAVDTVAQKIGDMSELATDEKDTVVGAMNETFTDASEGKGTIAAALTGKGQPASAAEPYASLAGKIGNLAPAGYVDPSGYVPKMVVNAGGIVPSGTYASSTYYDTGYGVKVGYQEDGGILLSMKGGTSTAYEYLYFYLASAPSGVTITEAHNTSSSYASAMPGLVYACVLSGITRKVNISINMGTVNSTGDYARVDITVTEV